MLHHIQVNPNGLTAFHTSIAHNQEEALAEFHRLSTIFPDQLVTLIAYQPHPTFITSNDENLNKRFQEKRLTGLEAQVDSPEHHTITTELEQIWQVAA